MRANPFHSYRGFRYYASAGVYRLTLPDGGKASFGAKQGSLQGLRNYVDAYIEEVAPSYPVAANPRTLSKAGKEGLHIVAKRRSPSKRGPEFSFSYSTRTPVMGVAEGQGGKTYATRTYMEDWKVNAEDLLSEYDAGYYADADITIFALDAQGVKHPLTLSGVRSMATSGSLPARRAANPRTPPSRFPWPESGLGALYSTFVHLRNRANDYLRDSRLPVGIRVSKVEADFPKARNMAYCSLDETSGDLMIGVSPKLLEGDTDRIEGVLRHEFGHAILLHKGTKHSERDADTLAEQVFGDPIFYDRETVQTLRGGLRPRPAYLGA